MMVILASIRCAQTSILLTEFLGHTPSHGHVDFREIFLEADRMAVVFGKLRGL